MSADGEQLTWYANVDDVRAGAAEPPGGYRLRPVDRADEQALTDLYFAAYAPHGVGSQEDAATEIAVTFAGEYGALDAPASPVACRGDDIVASVMLVLAAPWDDTPPLPFVIEVMVAPEHRRLGLAECGLRWAAERLAERGAARVGLRVMSDNEAAVALYRKLGFAAQA